MFNVKALIKCEIEKPRSQEAENSVLTIFCKLMLWWNQSLSPESSATPKHHHHWEIKGKVACLQVHKRLSTGIYIFSPRYFMLQTTNVNLCPQPFQVLGKSPGNEGSHREDYGAWRGWRWWRAQKASDGFREPLWPPQVCRIGLLGESTRPLLAIF